MTWYELIRSEREAAKVVPGTLLRVTRIVGLCYVSHSQQRYLWPDDVVLLLDWKIEAAGIHIVSMTMLAFGEQCITAFQQHDARTVFLDCVVE